MSVVCFFGFSMGFFIDIGTVEKKTHRYYPIRRKYMNHKYVILDH